MEERIAALEAQVAALRAELDRLRQRTDICRQVSATVLGHMRPHMPAAAREALTRELVALQEQADSSDDPDEATDTSIAISFVTPEE